jgi:uncharacterized protein YndB with AHSA1/START domain
MENKTKVHAEDGKQELVITREFDLPLELLFKAYTDPHIVAKWMGTKVLNMDSKKHGSYRFETSNKQGKVVFEAHGVIHELLPTQKIVRTFEMEGMPFGVQLEILEFKKLTDDISKLNMHTIYESVAHRDENLKLPFTKGINMAHNRLQEIVSKLN